MSRPPIVETTIRDVRYALRLMRRTPAFSAAAVTTLAVAIAANVAVFSVADAVLLRPLPYPNPESLALVTRGAANVPAENFDTSQTGRTWEAIRDHVTAADRAVFSTWTTGVNMVADGAAGHVTQQRVGAGFFRVLGAPLLLGREFTAEEDRPGGPAVAILSAALWRGTFGADPSVIGRTLTLRGESYEIVGVMPDGFESGQPADVWTPLRPSRTGEGGGENYQIIVRAADRQQALGEIAAIGADLARERPAANALTLSLQPLQAAMTRSLRQPILMLWWAVGVVLVVACVNLAGLLLARGSGRSREIATRMALGSGRAGVMRQLFVESVVLAAFGGSAGVLLGNVALHALTPLALDAFDIWQPIALDGRAIAAAAVLALLSSIGFGIAPALQASHLSPLAGLRDGGRGIAGRRGHWPRRVLVVTQVALGLVLLIAAALLVRTFAHLRGLEPGFDPDGLVAASISLEDARYKTGVRVTRLFEESLAAIRRVPGVHSAAVSLGVPYQRLLNLGFRHVDPVPNAASKTGITSAAYIAGDYFPTMRIPVRSGRTFDERDTTASPGVVIVNEEFVNAYLSDRPALGRRIALAGREREVVGVVGNVQVRPGWGNNGPLAAMPLAYIPVAQTSDATLTLVHGWFNPVLIVRTPASPEHLARDLRRAADTVDPLLPFASVRSLDEVKASSLGFQRFLMALLAGLAGTAVLLAVVGLHGLIAASVAERRREMGIRLALGATAAGAVRTLAAPGIIMAAVGVVLGTAASLASARVVRHFVWGVSATDPLTLGAVALLFLSIASMASVVPALRLLRLDPATTLRQAE
jgi:predicted permease